MHRSTDSQTLKTVGAGKMDGKDPETFLSSRGGVI
jgi:hypothetical protein